MSDSDFSPNGRFQKGGPGRPRRAIESDYLATLSEAVPLSVWQEIVAKAVDEGREGDHAALRLARRIPVRQAHRRRAAQPGRR